MQKNTFRFKNLFKALMLLTAFGTVIQSAVFAQAKTKSRLKKILVFSKTAGFRHSSIGAGKTMFLSKSGAAGYQADTTEDASIFTKAGLKPYKAVVFLNTTGDVLDSLQQIAFKDFIHQGGGYIGIHAATDTEYGWPWYNQLSGAYFDNHPKPQTATFHVLDKKFIATEHLPDSLIQKEEIYNFKSVQPGLHYLISVDESSYQGGNMGKFHPISWYHTFEGGRAFYIEWGHFDSTFSAPGFQQLIYKALDWATAKK